jgi:ATP-dependent RNA helicase DeaD
LNVLYQRNSEPLRRNLKKKVIQRDVLFQSQTGTGKTLSYLIPLISSISKSKGQGTHLIVSPSRELANQIVREIGKISKNNETISVFTALAGPNVTISAEEQAKEILKLKPKIIVATPTRLHNLIESQSNHKDSLKEYLKKSLKSIILDEMDFLIKPLSKYAPTKLKQNREIHQKPTSKILSEFLDKNPSINIIGCSATINRPLLALFTNTWNRKPTLLKYSESLQIPSHIQHSFILSDSEISKVDILCQIFEKRINFVPNNTILSNNTNVTNTTNNITNNTNDTITSAPLTHRNSITISSALVFIPNEIPISEFVNAVNKKGHNAVALYKQLGTSTPSQFKEFEEKFKSGEIRIVVANYDIGRGINFEWLKYVIIVEPTSISNTNTYLHLSGRTGRLGKEGHVVSIMSNDNTSLTKVKQLQNYFNIQMSEMKLEEIK